MERKHSNMKDYSQYNVKSVSLELKDVDETGRKVSGYLSAFDVLDSDNDIIRSGAFVKSLSERGPGSSGNRKIAHLRHHDWQHQIGRFTELEEDSKGLRFVSELGSSTKGNDALLDYKDGIIREHSIGFNYIGDKIKEVEDSDNPMGHFYEVTEVKLWEGSAVTFGANEFTPVLEAGKSILDSDYVKRLNDEMDSLIKAIKSGKGTDDRLYNIEMRLKVIQTKYNSLINLEPKDSKGITQEVGKPNSKQNQDEELRKFLLKHLKK
jgi:HK97 family phage prohead protease